MKLVASEPSSKGVTAPLSSRPDGDGSLGAGIWRFWVPGPMPGLNDVIEARMIRRGKWNAYTDMKRMWTGTVAMLANRAGLPKLEHAHLAMLHYEPNMKRDPDNFVAGAQKFIIDGLVAAGVLPNDGWAQIASLQHQWYCNKLSPGVAVFLTTKQHEMKTIFLLDRQSTSKGTP